MILRKWARHEDANARFLFRVLELTTCTCIWRGGKSEQYKLTPWLINQRNVLNQRNLIKSKRSRSSQWLDAAIKFEGTVVSIDLQICSWPFGRGRTPCLLTTEPSPGMILQVETIRTKNHHFVIGNMDENGGYTTKNVPSLINPH